MKTRSVRFLIIPSVILACILSMGHFMEMTGAYTGAPGEQTCVSCHTVDNFGTSGGSALLGLPSHVVAGQTYLLTMLVYTDNDLGQTAGFQLTFLDDNQATFGVMESMDPHVSIRTFSNKSYAQHEPGVHFFDPDNAIVDTVRFDFSWTPPVSINEPQSAFSWYNALVGNGNYSITAGHRGDTMFAGNRITTVIPQLSAEIVIVTTPLCNDSAEGSLEVTVDGGMAPLDIQWSTGETTSIISNLDEGLYSVTISDALGQEVVLQQQLDAPQLLAVDAEVSEPDCVGGATGSVLLTVAGGTQPYTYVFEGELVPSPLITNLGAGDYSAQVMDAHGCSTDIQVSLSEPSPITVEVIDVAPQTMDMLGAIIIEVAGGTPPYDFFWEGPDDFNSTMQNPFNLAAGEYRVTITDAQDCQLLFSIEVDFSSSIHDPTLEQFTLRISPNPGTSELQIVFPLSQTPDWNVQILSTTGHVVLHDSASGTDYKISERLVDWPPGVYMISVQHRYSGQRWTQRWLKLAE